jgi:hypothetical protein
MTTTLPRTKSETASISFIGLADDAILRAINRYHLVTAEQICRLLYKPSVISYVRSRLSHLANADYLLRSDMLRPSRTGTGPIVYSLGPKGRKYLQSLDVAVPERLRKGVAREYGYLHLKHALGVTDILLAADLVARAEPRFRVATLLHEQALKRKGVKVEVAQGQRETVQPDAWLDLRLERERWYQNCVAIEFDRGSEHQPAWRSKVAALLAWSRGPYSELFGTDSLTIAVITTAGEDRLRSLVRWTETELTARAAEGAGELFCLTACEPSTVPPASLFFSPIWSVPFAPEPTGLLSIGRSSG